MKLKGPLRHRVLLRIEAPTIPRQLLLLHLLRFLLLLGILPANPVILFATSVIGPQA
jgi:hypothetical protein